MCTNGVNTQQLKDTIEMIDAQVALSRRWTHKMYHLADNGQMERSAKKLKAIQALLDDVRSEFEELQDVIERDDAEVKGVEVELV